MQFLGLRMARMSEATGYRSFAFYLFFPIPETACRLLV
jgi:hypothetical protein